MIKRIIALTGPARSGKTTFADACSKQCNWPVIDLVQPMKALMSSVIGQPLADSFKEQDFFLDFATAGYEAQHSSNGREMLTMLCSAIEADFGGTAVWCAIALAKYEHCYGAIISNVYKQEQFNYLANHCELVELIELAGSNIDCKFRSKIASPRKIQLAFSSAEEAETAGLSYGDGLKCLERYYALK